MQKSFGKLTNWRWSLQAFEYEEEQGVLLEEFFLNADLFIKEKILREIFEEILKERESVRRVGVQIYESS